MRLKLKFLGLKKFRTLTAILTCADLSFGERAPKTTGRMLMGNLLSLVTIVYFVAVILAVYHLQQKEIDRMQRQIDENNCLLDEMQRRLHIQST